MKKTLTVLILMISFLYSSELTFEEQYKKIKHEENCYRYYKEYQINVLDFEAARSEVDLEKSIKILDFVISSLTEFIIEDCVKVVDTSKKIEEQEKLRTSFKSTLNMYLDEKTIMLKYEKETLEDDLEYLKNMNDKYNKKISILREENK